MSDRSPLDEFTIRMENAVDRFIGNHHASQNFVQFAFATDESAGQYPQAARDQSREYLEDDGDQYLHRFPRLIHEPILLRMRRGAKWTDVLSSDLWSEGMLVTESVLAILERFPLGHVKRYKAEVHRGKEKREYTYLFFANHVTLDDIDFSKAEFYIADMIGSPQRLIDVDSAVDYQRKREQIAEGKLEGCRRFSRLETKSIPFRPGHAPSVAVFGLGSLGVTTFMRRELCDALRQAGVSGMGFKRNNKLFES